MQFTTQRIQRRAHLGREQLGQRLGQALVEVQPVGGVGHGQLVGGNGTGRQRIAAGHVDAHALRVVGHVELQERRERAEVGGRETTIDAAVGHQEVEPLTQVVETWFGQCLQGAVQGGGAGHMQLVAAAARGQFGLVHAAGGLHVVAVDGQRTDRVARGDGAFHAGVAEAADALQGALGAHERGAAGLHAIERDHATGDVQVGVVEHAAGIDPAVAADIDEGHVAQRAVEQELATGDVQRGGQRVDAVQLQHALTHDRAVEAVVAAQAQPADAGLGEPARAADVVGPVVPRIAFPHLQAAGLGVHHHVGVHAQLAVAFDGLGQVHQAPAVDIVHAGGTEVGGGGQQHVAHLRAGQVREALEQQAQRAGDVRCRHRGAGHHVVAVGRHALDHVQQHVALRVREQLRIQRRIAAVDGRQDVGTRCSQAPVGAEAAAIGADVQHVAAGLVLADVDHAQPVLLDVAEQTRQRGVDAGDRRLFRGGGVGIVVACGPHLDHALAARTFREDVQVLGRAGVQLVLGGQIGRLVGQAPAVVDRAHALVVHLRVHVLERAVVRADAAHADDAVIAAAHIRPHLGAVEEQLGSGQVRAVGNTVGAAAITVGRDGAGHVRSMGLEMDACLEVAGVGLDDVADSLRHAGVVGDVVDRDLVAVARKAGVGTIDQGGVGAAGAIGQQVGNAQAAVVLAGEVRVVQARAAVEHAQADALAGQATRVSDIGVDRAQAPVGVELGAAPAFGVAGGAVDRARRRSGGGTHGADVGHVGRRQLKAEGRALQGALLLVGGQGIGGGAGQGRYGKGGQQGSGDGRCQQARRRTTGIDAGNRDHLKTTSLK
ncbi:hypothetical protein D3C71_805430 [compost metagenome]